jgi:acyl carrier protein
MDEKIKEICAKVLRCSPAGISPSSRLVEDLGADSLDLTDIAMLLEDEYGTVLSERDLSTNSLTVQALIDRVGALAKKADVEPQLA